MKKKLLFLGTGGSVGIPVIGCSCAVCHSKEPRNQRLRPSVLLQLGNRQFLIDAGPDFRLQALRYEITALDGVLLTHAHHDHTAGMDDLRPIYYRRHSPLPILLSAETAQELHLRFSYLFQPNPGHENFTHRFRLQILPEAAGHVSFEDVEVQYMTYSQGGMSVNGFRVGDLAYLSDIRHYSPSIFDHLFGVRYLIISALRYTPSPLHFSVDEAIDFAKKVQAKQVWLTHISHDLEHNQTNAYLPANMCLAYDGLQIEFE
jgi:phosphoribosyl 1,2-cyclic phosphate phosphodiesterase